MESSQLPLKKIRLSGGARKMLKQKEKSIKGNRSILSLTTKSGLQIPRLWLCYSILLNRVYCETCWLFANRNQKGFKNNWIVGINDWHHMNDKINDHEKSQTHI